MRGEECWAVETSSDGERWRRFGKAWRAPMEPVLMHAVPRFVRFRRLLPEEDPGWSRAIEMQRDLPMSLISFEQGTREDLWPGEEHAGLPVLLPGGEEGRLVRFQHDASGTSWSYTLEFRGHREVRPA